MWATEQRRQNGKVTRTLKESQNPKFRFLGYMTVRKITSSPWIPVAQL